MKDLIINTFDRYNPNEFMPIFVDGQLDNKNEFLIYKAKRAARIVSRQISRLQTR
jgi:hypothetical protein